MSGVLGSLGCQTPRSAGATSQSQRICDFNDELLASAGSSRDDFTPFYEEWLQSPRAPEFLDRAASLLEEEFGSIELFVLSDPSICRLLPFWIEALKRFGCTPEAVIVARNPADPSDRRQNEALGQMVWLRNMLAAESGTRGMRRACTSFEELVKDWENVATKAQTALKLVWPRAIASVEFEVASLFDRLGEDRSVTSTTSRALLPSWLQQSSEILSRWAVTGEDPSDYEALDRIRAEFDVAASAFARVIRGVHAMERVSSTGTRPVRASGMQEIQGADATGLKAMLQEQRRKTTLLNADLHKQIEARETLEAQLIEAQAELEASRARRKEMARVIANRDAKIDRLYGELGALQRHVVRSSPLWQVKAVFRRLGRSVRRSAPTPSSEAQSLG